MKTDFCIGIAAYPKGHPECKSGKKNIQHLKQKFDSGTDFAITQLFVDANAYLIFINKCKAIGIEKPIVPGIMVIHSYKQLGRFREICGVNVPKELEERLKKHKDDAEAVRSIGIEHAIRMCNAIREATPGFHFYTLNRAYEANRVMNSLF